jgi:hypothetical protein
MLLRVKTEEYINQYDHINIGDIYIALASELREGITSVLIVPFYLGSKYTYLDYLDHPFLPSIYLLSSFDLIVDEISSKWKTDNIKEGDESVIYRSFEEWFKSGYYIRAHDYDLTNNDLIILNKYVKEYSNIYRKYLINHTDMPEIEKLNNKLASADIEYSERNPFEKLRNILKKGKN